MCQNLVAVNNGSDFLRFIFLSERLRPPTMLSMELEQVIGHNFSVIQGFI